MGKVLIVEDNALNMKLFHDLLMIKNHEVILSSDGVDVPLIVLQQKPDLILMDVQLNGLSGIDIIKQLRENELTKSVSIIAISAFAMKRDAKIISESGCDLYIPKPVSINDFFQAIERFIPSVTK
ncbi:MAG: response regulator [Rickettsiaceae bacterium]|nr:response regulator [Rickettsiaceae bacterium]